MTNVVTQLNIKTTEMHTAGEPVRIIESGYPEIIGNTLLEKREYLKRNLDWYRTLLMHEPRGHFDMYGVLLLQPDFEDVTTAVLFMHNEGYSTACGHVIISLGRYLVDQGFVKTTTSPETEVKIQCPSGIVTAKVENRDVKTGYVKFRNVPAYVSALETVDVVGFGKIEVDLCYGGAFYVVVSSATLGYHMLDTNISTLTKTAGDILEASRKQIKCDHEVPELAYVYGVMMIEEREERTINLCVFADRQVDRSPCGSGTTAVMALQHATGMVRSHQPRIYQSAVNKSEFIGTIVEEHVDGIQHKSVTVEVQGHGYYTGSSTFTLEEDDTLGKGFLVH